MEGPAEQGSRTITTTQTPPTFILRLQPDGSPPGGGEEEERHIQWAEGTVNNEHMQKKKSNKCCIFHKPKAFDESDTESDGCDSASDEEFSKKYPQFAVKKRNHTRKNRKKDGEEHHSCSHGHGHGHSHSHSHSHSHG